jgi:hypothetical protein
MGVRRELIISEIDLFVRLKWIVGGIEVVSHQFPLVVRLLGLRLAWYRLYPVYSVV